MKISHKRAGPVAGMKVQRCRREIVLASGMKFSRINTREIHPAYQAVPLSMPTRLPTAPYSLKVCFSFG